ncbi:MAG: ABC transporter permease [Candidatus Lambdaproteobacteria bacterium]|nr:ABC transporter permease [Candidatus Lambdaproteobacteria bacterium]
MVDILRIASRNLWRYSRRTLLTTLLVSLGILAVLLFKGVAGSFKTLMVGQITDSMLGHLQVHRKGYVASIDNLPLNLNLRPPQVERIEAALKSLPAVEAWSARVKFGAMFSNFTETTNIRLVGVEPADEFRTVPLLPGRVSNGSSAGRLLAPGQLLVPELLARGMKVKVGDTVVLVATNKDGSVNGQTFLVAGILASATGPGGRDGYVHIRDARTLLRMAEPEVSEVAIRLRALGEVRPVQRALEATLGGQVNPQGQPAFEVHPWEALTPFATIVRMIDLLTLFMQVMLVAIVLISIMNVMVMAVFERVREIGTIAAIGTKPGRILGLFVAEGLLLGVLGTAVGTAISLGAIWGLNLLKLTYKFGQADNLVLAPTLAAGDVLFIGALAILAAVLASLQPALKASRMDPIQALHHV